MRDGVAPGSTVRESGEQLPGVVQERTPSRPRAVLLGKAGLTSLTKGDLERKFSTVSRHLDAVVVGAGPARVGRLGLVRTVGVPRPLFYAAAPPLAVALAAVRPGTAITCQSPFEAFPALLASRLVPRRMRPAIVVEVRGDWRTATRLYGRPLRRLLAPVVDRCATWTVAHADHVRAIGSYTERLAREAGYAGETARLTTFSDVGQFMAPTSPVPADPRVAYVGALEPTKGVDLLLSAWPEILRRVPAAELVIAGDGALLGSLVDTAARLDVGGSVHFPGRLSRPGVAGLLDESSLLVLPSRSEGLGRVVMEAGARARAAVGANVGGIPEQIEDGVTGVLFPPGDVGAIAGAVADLLADRDRLVDMGDRAHARLSARDPVAEYEQHVAEFAEWIEARRAAR